MFGKPHRIKKRNLTCPYCSHKQEEPSLAISSFCKSCGDHFRIRKGIAFASPGLRVSGITEIRKPGEKANLLPFDWAKNPDTDSRPGEGIKEQAHEGAWLQSSEEDDGEPRPLPKQEDLEHETPVGISAGAFFGLTSEDNREEQDDSDATIGQKSQGKETLAEGSMEALIGPLTPAEAPEKEKMPPNYVPPERRKKATDSVSGFDVRCFRCYHVQSVSRFAKSTQCERCSAYISLANYEIQAHKSHTLRTRGDIVIGRRGGLKNSEIACHHLTVNGSIDAFVDCSGDATFRRSGVVRGHLYCRRILIEKNCEVEFPDGVMAQRAEIHGKLVGNLTCSGKLKLFRNGSVRGDVRAVEIDSKDEQAITGESTIDPVTSTDLPVKMGFNSSVIG